MNTDRELMQQALGYMESVGQMDMHPEEWAIAVALRERLAQPEQKPIARLQWADGWTVTLLTGAEDIPSRSGPYALYVGPAPEQPAHQEPYGYFRYDLRLDAWVQNRAGLTGTPFYTSPPASKPWVGLTDVEWMNIVNKDHAWFGQRPEDVAHEVAKLVEAKLREKNA